MSDDIIYSPAWWIPGGHLQTLWGKLARRQKPAPTALERWDTPDGDFLEVHRLGAADSSPRVMLLHGLEGTVRSHYAQGLLNEITTFAAFTALLMFVFAIAGVALGRGLVDRKAPPVQRYSVADSERDRADTDVFAAVGAREYPDDDKSATAEGTSAARTESLTSTPTEPREAESAGSEPTLPTARAFDGDRPLPSVRPVTEYQISPSSMTKRPAVKSRSAPACWYKNSRSRVHKFISD